ncbi:MAG: SDR family oxidoreductase [Rhodospirillales bacterium]
MGKSSGKVAWITGAGSGIGRASAIALALDGATVILTGRRREPLEEVAAEITKAAKGTDGKAFAEPADAGDAKAVQAIADRIKAKHGRLDILFNNAGLNVVLRNWDQLTPEGVDTTIDGNLRSAFYCTIAALPMMRAQKDGLIIHTSSWAGRYVSLVSGATYSAAKHAMLAMSESLNQQECMNGIRSCCLCPAEVATPILDKRPVPVSAEQRARMIQPEDMAAIVLFVAHMPASVVLNEILVSPTHNRGYVAALQQTGRA